MSLSNSTTASTKPEHGLTMGQTYVFLAPGAILPHHPSGPEIIKALRGARIRFDDRAHRLGRKRAREYRERKATSENKTHTNMG